jgi:hypothetical protein
MAHFIKVDGPFIRSFGLVSTASFVSDYNQSQIINDYMHVTAPDHLGLYDNPVVR